MFTWLKGLFRRRPENLPPQPGMLSLFFLNEGDHGELVCLNCSHTSRATALAVYGLVPGSRLILQQKRPSFVVRIGETELALDADIAKEIIVKRVVDPVESVDSQPH